MLKLTEVKLPIHDEIAHSLKTVLDTFYLSTFYLSNFLTQRLGNFISAAQNSIS